MLLLPLVAAVFLPCQEEPDLSWFGRRPQDAESTSPLDSLVQELLGADIRQDWSGRGVQWGVLLEGVGEFSEAKRVPRLNKFRLRSAQFHALAPLQDWGHAWAVADFADGGEGGDFLLREAGAWLQDLPGGLRLRAGKFFSDLGIWNTMDSTDFPALNLDGTRRALIGGRLALTGVELHHGLGEVGPRFSLGLASGVERQDSDSPNQGLSRLVDEGRTGVWNGAATVRAEVPWGTQFRFGMGGYYSPGEKSSPVAGSPELSNLLTELDVAWADSGLEGSELAASLELWFRTGEVQAASRVRESGGSGFTLTAERALGQKWGTGLVASRWSAFGARGNGHHHAAFVERSLGVGHRLRGSFGHLNPGPGEQKFFSVGLQWILEFGAPLNSNVR